MGAGEPRLERPEPCVRRHGRPRVRGSQAGSGQDLPRGPDRDRLRDGHRAGPRPLEPVSARGRGGQIDAERKHPLDDARPTRPRFWEAGFFGLFALTITNAVEVAGVLMVFAYLIIPAFVASVWTGSFGRRLAFGWGFGTAASLLGVSLSYGYDLPTGATIVTLMGVLAGALGGVRRFGASAV
ncbi:MAG: metal ABC transporter permease [Nitrospirae bacterium]|nr:metal ABC transporter permease [Nitrospirota bacterium]